MTPAVTSMMGGTRREAATPGPPPRPVSGPAVPGRAPLHGQEPPPRRREEKVRAALPAKVPLELI